LSKDVSIVFHSSEHPFFFFFFFICQREKGLKDTWGEFELRDQSSAKLNLSCTREQENKRTKRTREQREQKNKENKELRKVTSQNIELLFTILLKRVATVSPA